MKVMLSNVVLLPIVRSLKQVGKGNTLATCIWPGRAHKSQQLLNKPSSSSSRDASAHEPHLGHEPALPSTEQGKLAAAGVNHVGSGAALGGPVHRHRARHHLDGHLDHLHEGLVIGGAIGVVAPALGAATIPVGNDGIRDGFVRECACLGNLVVAAGGGCAGRLWTIVGIQARAQEHKGHGPRWIATLS